MKKRHVNLTKIDRMSGLAFENCIRLHLDSITLYNSKSFPSAYFLSILALEEFGKVVMLEDFLWHSRIDGRFNSIEDKELEKKIGPNFESAYLGNIYNHIFKQYRVIDWADCRFKPKNVITKQILNKRLQDLKNDSIYVGFKKTNNKFDIYGRLTNPLKVGEEKAKKQITYISDCLLWLILGAIKETHILETNCFEKIINQKLYNKLNKKWLPRSAKTKKLLEKLEEIE